MTDNRTYFLAAYKRKQFIVFPCKSAYFPAKAIKFLYLAETCLAIAGAFRRRTEPTTRRIESTTWRTESPIRRIELTTQRIESPIRRIESTTWQTELAIRRIESTTRQIESAIRRAEPAIQLIVVK